MLLQQMKALLENVGSSFCPDYSDWSGTDAGDMHSRNADKSVVSKFLQAHPTDYSTKKLQVSLDYHMFNFTDGNILISPYFVRVKFVICSSFYYIAKLHISSC